MAKDAVDQHIDRRRRPMGGDYIYTALGVVERAQTAIGRQASLFCRCGICLAVFCEYPRDLHQKTIALFNAVSIFKRLKRFNKASSHG